MPGKSISFLDKKGRVLIPQSIRDALNLKDGEKVVLELDTGAKSLKIEPAHEKRLLKMRILLCDRPGSLAAAAAVLARLKVDLVSTQSHSSSRGTAAEWVVECNPGGKGAAEMKAALSKAGASLLEAKWE